MTKSDSKTTEDGMVEIGEISSAWGNRSTRGENG